MKGISRSNLMKACEVLDASGNKDLAKKILEFDFIPKMYVYTFLKRFYKEIKGAKTTTVEELDFEPLEGLSLDIVTKSNLNGFKELLRIAFDRENYICDFEDTKHPSKITGQCQNEDHEMFGSDGKEEQEMEELSLVLMPDEFNKKFDDNSPEYWCKDCCEQVECDVNVQCDMDIGE